MNTAGVCPICQNSSGATAETGTSYDTGRTWFICPTCGKLETTRIALMQYLPRDSLTSSARAALSHHVAVNSVEQDALPFLSQEFLSQFLRSARLPSMQRQAINLVRLVGDHERDNDDGFSLPSARNAALVGAKNSSSLHNLVNELLNAGVLRELSSGYSGRPGTYGLTMLGWDKYEAEIVGKVSSRRGFIALKFGDPILEGILDNSIRPSVKRDLAYEVVDMRTVARAGVIDNILRQEIRDAAFVIVDLTHDNAGAYWEAGYAEGLGKPVIYICEAGKFNAKQTHFDTNHCTTVMWTADNSEEFERQLIATLRRSLNLFEK